MSRTFTRPGAAVRLLLLSLAAVPFALAAAFFIPGNAFALVQPSVTYTTTADFDEGVKLNVISHDDELKLPDDTEPFGFIWVAVSSKNTIVKIDTATGEVVGEYWSAPQSSGRGDPSRTTVDKNGSVWVGNRGGGSVVHIGLEENGRCIDRNGNGQIDTSSGLGDIRPWPGADSAADAEDECVVHYVQTAGSDVRHVSVDANNNIWVSGINARIFQLIDGATGEIVRTEASVGFGGYGGLIDGNGVLWSARPLLRWDPMNPLSGPNGENWLGYGHDSYGLCIDSQGNVWNTSLYGDNIFKFDPDGNLLGQFPHGSYYAQGCVVDRNDHVWVAGSLYGGTVGHLLNDGTYVGNVAVGSGPTGVAVDANGKIWATNYNEGTVSRIDPTLGPIGGGEVPVGAVDFTTVALGGNTYNYSDMTGSTLIGAPDNGRWTIVRDTGIEAAPWGTISWTEEVEGDGEIEVTAATSEDGVTFSPPAAVENGQPLAVPDGRYIRVQAIFTRATTGESPVLLDITVGIFVPEPFCGDGNVDAGEECDDGNSADGDGCDADCVLEVCGNGKVQAGEECDDGNSSDNDACTNECLFAVCGDGLLHDGEEECDFGAGDSHCPGNLSCLDDCTCGCPGVCGDPAPVFGRISVIDAQYILRGSVELEVCPLCVCDVDSSGVVSSADALRDLQYAVGLPVVIDCTGPAVMSALRASR